MLVERFQNLQIFGNGEDGNSHSDGDRNIKKVRFKEGLDGEVVVMAVDPDPTLTLSWKDKLLGGGTVNSEMDCNTPCVGRDSDLELLEGDVRTTIVNGIPAITFSNRVKEIMFKEMELTVVLKLLGRPISQYGDGLDLVSRALGLYVQMENCGGYRGAGGAIGGVVEERGLEYGSWMLVERRLQRGQRITQANDTMKSRKKPLGSRFTTLNMVGEMSVEFAATTEEIPVENVRQNDCGGLGGNNIRARLVRCIGIEA
ncbi:hypothetical protein Goarm_020021 [Gossypium armourianum]|uniref:Uncharacterized protein n=1 Tax=Gossypium armourianum TaxID=34283 RepID=A0A7J9IMF9_9ROSI|nr:hypothetical protein [Gossypium armourianum]